MSKTNEVVEIFGQELDAVIQREISEPAYMNADDFVNCEERGNAMIDAATVRVKKIMGLAIAKHRREEHGENTDGDMQLLSASLSEKDIEIAFRGWWHI